MRLWCEKGGKQWLSYQALGASGLVDLAEQERSRWLQILEG
jgi:hypothetical protein